MPNTTDPLKSQITWTQQQSEAHWSYDDVMMFHWRDCALSYLQGFSLWQLLDKAKRSRSLCVIGGDVAHRQSEAELTMIQQLPKWAQIYGADKCVSISESESSYQTGHSIIFEFIEAENKIQWNMGYFQNK